MAKGVVVIAWAWWFVKRYVEAIILVGFMLLAWTLITGVMNLG